MWHSCCKCTLWTIIFQKTNTCSTLAPWWKTTSIRNHPSFKRSSFSVPNFTQRMGGGRNGGCKNTSQRKARKFPSRTWHWQTLPKTPLTDLGKDFCLRQWPWQVVGHIHDLSQLLDPWSDVSSTALLTDWENKPNIPGIDWQSDSHMTAVL